MSLACAPSDSAAPGPESHDAPLAIQTPAPTLTDRAGNERFGLASALREQNRRLPHWLDTELSEKFLICISPLTWPVISQPMLNPPIL